MITLFPNRIPKPLVSYRTFRAMAFASVMLLSFAAYAQPMSGTYTVCAGGSCNYSTIQAAVDDINTNGINGPVVIDIKAGNYNESGISIGSSSSGVSGVSSANTITIKGAGRNSTKVSASASYIFRVYYTDYVRIMDMEVSNTANTNTFARTVLVYESDYCQVKKCNLNMTVHTGWANDQYVLHMYRTAYGVFSNNNIKGGFYGIYNETGWNPSSLLTTDTISNNRVTQYWYTGIYNQYKKKQTVISNTVDSNGYDYAYGIYSIEGEGDLYENNIVMTNNISLGTGMYFETPNASSSANPFRVYNNLVGPNIVDYAIFMSAWGGSTSSNRNVKVIHNTLVADQGSSSWGGVLYVDNYNSPGYEVRNNLVVSDGGSAIPFVWYSFDPASGDVMDGNNYYANTASALLNIYGNTYADLASFQKDWPGSEEHGSSIQPTFKSSTDLHLDQNAATGSGWYAGIDKDIDGDSRCMLFPTAGADESNYGKNAFKAQFFVPSTVYDGSPVVFYNSAKASEPKVHRWYIDGVFVTDSVHLASVLTGTSHTVSLATRGCAGYDSITKTVTITQPPTVPVSDFIADQNIFAQGGVVRLTDLSSYGPGSWKWEITPEQTYVGGALVDRYKYILGTSSTSQNPVVQFTSAGKYKICMTATNVKGGGNEECKVDYIEVTPQLNMGDVEETRAPQGVLFDDGGSSNDVMVNGKTKLLINACAEEVYFMISKFDMACAENYLRIYDGAVEDDQYALHPCTDNDPWYPGSTGFTGGPSGWSCGSDECLPDPKDTFVAKSGKMLIVLDVHYTWGGSPGFEAIWWSKPKTFTPPVAGIESDSMVCQNGLLTLKNTSTGEDNTYSWDLDNDLNTFEATDADETQWLFTIPGKQKVTLIAENCGGIDTFVKEITVFAPNKPNISFSASNTRPTPADVVFITSEIPECVEEYEWSFKRSSGKPGTVTYMNGSSKFAENPEVMFSDTGCWDATLVATNVGGASTLKKNCFVNVKEPYCVPTVATMSKDIGISEVAIMASDSSDLMRNPSDQAKKDYTNYANDPNLSTGLEIGVTYLVEVKRNTNANNITREIWIDWNLDGDFNDPAEEVAAQPSANSQSWIAAFTVPIIAKTGASIMRVAVNTGQYENEVCGQNRFGEFEDYRVELSDDRTAPVITLFGADGKTAVANGDTIVIEQGRKYTEWGFKAIDNLDGDITSSVTSDTTALPNGPTGMLNTFVVRNYMISYYAQDATGNPSKATNRIVKVIEDTTSPSLTVGGTDTMRHDVDASNFQMPKVISVNDIVDGIGVNMKTEVYNDGVIVPLVDPAVVDTYTVVFTATDAAGNTKEIIRVIIVEDITDPMLTLDGDNPVNHPVFTKYEDAGVVATDNYWTDPRLSEGITSTDLVNVNVIGTYTYEYSLIDPSGNGPVTAVRTVNVVDEEAPLASVQSGDTIRAEVMTEFNYPPVNYSDNYFGDGDLQTEWMGTLIPTMQNGVLTKVGTFTLEFVVTDPSNNTTTIEKTVIVSDNTPPVIELVGNSTVSICRWEEYVDAGYTLSDNYWANANIDVVQEGTFISGAGSDLPDIYDIRYKATDSSGNFAYSDARVILVKSEFDFPCNTNSIEDAASLEKLVNVYPNPSTGSFTVKVGLESQQQLRISVMNLLGEELVLVNEGQVLSEVYNVDLSTQASGVYMLQVQGADFSFTKRLLLQK